MKFLKQLERDAVGAFGLIFYSGEFNYFVSLHHKSDPTEKAFLQPPDRIKGPRDL